jgi:hypothetical protein
MQRRVVLASISQNPFVVSPTVVAYNYRKPEHQKQAQAL